MEKLWAPWRVNYIKQTDRRYRPHTFTRIIKSRDDKNNFVIFRRELSFCVLNIYPYNNGHLLIVPNRRVDDISKLKRAEREDLMDSVEIAKNLLEDTMKPQGFNIGLNLGSAAGAGIPQHIHFHIVPRWKGDSNFMPVVGETKVISQSLKESYKLLRDAYKKKY